MKRFNITVNGKAYDVAVEEITNGAAPAPVAAAPAPTAAPAATVAAAPADAVNVVAPMTGTILAVNVNVGDEVKEGQPVVVLEAMKMENDIVASTSGKVVAVAVKKGDAVKTNDILVSIK